MTVGEGVDSVIESALIGFGGAIKTVAVVAHRVLSLRPATVEADLRAYLAMRSLADEAALVEAEEKEEVLAPFWSDGGPTEWLEPPAAVENFWCFTHECPVKSCPEKCETRIYRLQNWQPDSLFPSGQPSDDLPSEADCRAEHPLYRQIQDAFQSSAPVAHSPEPVVAESPGVAPPKSATPGQPQPDFSRDTEDFEELITSAGPNDLNTAILRIGDETYRLHSWERGTDVPFKSQWIPTLKELQHIKELMSWPVMDSVSPAGTGAQAGTGGSPKHLVTDGVSGIHSGDGATSDLLYAAANQLAELRYHRSPDSLQWRYMGELIPELRDRAEKLQNIGD